MKHVLLMLIALIFAAPVWAADAATAPTAATSSTQAEAPAAKAVKKTKKRKPAKKSMKASSATLTCPTGCGPQTCSGVQICAKNKPNPQCTAC